MSYVGHVVKVWLKTGLAIEGVLEDVGDDFIFLKADDCLLHIFDPSENVIMMKVEGFFKPEEPKKETVPIKPPESKENELDLKMMSVAKLQMKKAKEEQELVKSKLRTFSLTPTEVIYGKPNFEK